MADPTARPLRRGCASVNPPIATTWRQPASALGARMNAASCVWSTAGRYPPSGDGQQLLGYRRVAAAGLAVAIEERDLADRGDNPGILGRGGERVAPAQGGPERRHAIDVDAWRRAGERNRRTPVISS